jgi:hypothetical protein
VKKILKSPCILIKKDVVSLSVAQQKTLNRAFKRAKLKKKNIKKAIDLFDMFLLC